MSAVRPYSSSAMATGLAALALAAGCSGIPQVKVPDTVKVQVPVACISPADRPQRPALRAESDLMAMDRYRRTLAAWSDLKKLEGYSAELEALVEGCSRIPISTDQNAGGPPMK